MNIIDHLNGVMAAHRPFPGSATYSEHGDPLSDPEESESGLHYQRKNKCLLLVDDDVDRERISRILKKCDIPVTLLTARNGEEAVQKARSEAVDLLLLDYQLGDMTATELLALMRNNRNDIPAIMVTGMGEERIVVEALRLGVVDYIPKHAISTESLLTAIASVLKSIDREDRLRSSQKHLERLSLYDELTGLPNRNLFFDRLKQAIVSGVRNNSGFTVCMIDLNLFKEVNDSLGHAAGDKVLAFVGDALRNSARQSDTMARIGGDEFACILHDVNTKDAAVACVTKMIENISKPIALNNHILQIGASIGFSRYPDHGHDHTTLLSNADSAMYEAKRSHRKYLSFEDILKDNVRQREHLGQYLYDAIQKKEFFLEYQPKVSMTDSSLSAEALVRWNSSILGLVAPGEFIHVAERSSLIKGLTLLTMEMAFEQVGKWKHQGYEIPVSVNISARLLDDHTFPDMVAERLSDYECNPENVTFEITETALASSGSVTHQVIQALINLGIRISIDDFGSGYTSFRYIRDISFSELKIDMTYVKGMCANQRDMSLVQSMVKLALSLGMRSVAEGVETQEQYFALQDMGCHDVQGYGIARPMSDTAFTSWVETVHRVGGKLS